MKPARTLPLQKDIGTPLRPEGFLAGRRRGRNRRGKHGQCGARACHRTRPRHCLLHHDRLWRWRTAACLPACRKGRRENIIVPLGAGVGSAIGFLHAPIAYEVTRSAHLSLDAFNATAVNTLLQQMTQGCPRRGEARARQNQGDSRQIIADCRYVGQGHEIRVTRSRARLTRWTAETEGRIRSAI